MHIPNAELLAGQATRYKGPRYVDRGWQKPYPRRAGPSNATHDPWQRQVPSRLVSGPSSGSPLLGKQWSTVLQCDMTGEVAMTYKHAARDLAPIRRLTLQSVGLLRGADHLNTEKTRRLHQVTSQSTRDTSNLGPKQTHATRETSTA